MSLGFTESIGSTTWSQVGDDTIELRIPAQLPDGVRPKDLSVTIKDSTILVVAAGPVKIIQWRLYGPVHDESEEEAVEWVVEDDVLVIDLKKKVPGADWTCLLDLPIRPNDPLMVPKEELDKMIAQQFPPQVFPSEKKPEDDIDAILDATAEEVVSKKKEEEQEEEETDSDPSTIAVYLRHERKNMLNTEKTIKEKLAAAEEAKKKAEEKEGEAESGDKTDEKEESVEDTIPIMKKMLAYHDEIKKLRSQKTTIDSFIEVTRLGIELARVNSGSVRALEGLDEEEPFADEKEKELTPTQLLTLALSGGDLDEPARLHFLRLAAIQHSHAQSIAVLFSRYPNMPIGPHLMLKRALDDKDPSPEANHMIGDLFSSGSKFFVPLFPAALYFYQRAAQQGYVAAMLSLSQMWSRGATENSLLSDEDTDGLKNVSWFHAWLQKASDRGSGAAMFVQGCAYISGDYGLKPSYTKAKALLEAAAKTGGEVELLVRNSNVSLKLERLKEEEQQQKSGSPATAATTGSSTSASVSAPASSEARLSALSSSRAATLSTDRREAVERSKKVGASTGNLAAGARRMRFWERVGRNSVIAYGIFTLAFPFRVMFLPYFYELLSGVVQGIPWLANTDYAGGMF